MLVCGKVIVSTSNEFIEYGKAGLCCLRQGAGADAAGAENVIQSMDALFYAGREDMVSRAAEAIRKVLG